MAYHHSRIRRIRILTCPTPPEIFGLSSRQEGGEEDPIDDDFPEILDQIQAFIDRGDGNNALVIRVQGGGINTEAKVQIFLHEGSIDDAISIGDYHDTICLRDYSGRGNP